MELVVTQVQGGVDGFEGLEIYVDFLFFTFFSDNGSTVDHLNWELKPSFKLYKAKVSLTRPFGGTFV